MGLRCPRTSENKQSTGARDRALGTGGAYLGQALQAPSKERKPALSDIAPLRSRLGITIAQPPTRVKEKIPINIPRRPSGHGGQEGAESAEFKNTICPDFYAGSGVFCPASSSTICRIF